MKANHLVRITSVLALLGAGICQSHAVPPSSAITYQGRLTAGGTNFTGTGYFKFTLVNAGADLSRQATAYATLSAGKVISIGLSDGGSGYATAPTVSIQPVPSGPGSGATATAVVSGGAVTGFIVTAQGSGYTAGAVVTIGAPPVNYSYQTYWANNGIVDASGEPTLALGLPVANGLFQAVLGGADTIGLPAELFMTNDVQLRMWFAPSNSGPFQALLPVQPLTAAPYAMMAAQASNVLGVLPAGALSGAYSKPVQMTSTANQFNGAFSGDGGGLTNLNATALASGTVADARLSTGIPRLSSSQMFTASNVFWGVTIATNVNSQFAGNGAGLTSLNAGSLASGTVPDARLSASFPRTNQVWLLSGNPNTTAGANFIGTTDNQPLELRVNSQRALRLEPNASGAPNMIGGAAANLARSGVVGATIAGGGATNFLGGAYTNRVDDNFGTIGGGVANTISSNAFESTIAGGYFHSIQTDAYESSIGGGYLNTVATGAHDSTIAGGWGNTAAGTYNTIGGGYQNLASNLYATVGGGYQNAATQDYAVVVGGYRNSATRRYSYVGGGYGNTASGRGAVVAGGGYDGGLFNPNIASGDGATVSGGVSNSAAGYHSTIGGGLDNVASQVLSAVGGGYHNLASGWGAVVGGGQWNWATNGSATVAGGSNNIAGGAFATIGGGETNFAGGDEATVGGGFGNQALANYSVVAGGYKNQTTGDYAFIGAGGLNTATAFGSSVGGGYYNSATGQGAVVAGGGYGTNALFGNIASALNSTVSGGDQNQAINTDAVVGGGRHNIASGVSSSVSGGEGNQATGYGATVAGGVYNSATADGAIVAGGGYVAGITPPYASAYGNVASGVASAIFAGNSNRASGYGATIVGSKECVASGIFATIVGGDRCVASGTHAFVFGGFGCAATNNAFAAGSYAKAYHEGSVVWSDGSAAVDFQSTAKNQFSVLASGGIRLYTSGGFTSGMTMSPGGSGWNAVSDRNAKENFQRLDSREVLEKVAAMPISEWNLKAQDSSIHHIGPMAQDFYAAFHLNGTDDRWINSCDIDGVALAAIQGVNQKLEETRAENAEIKKRLERLESLLSQQSGGAK